MLLLHVSVINLFLLLYNILVYEYASNYFSILLLKDIWTVSHSVIMNKAAVTILSNFFFLWTRDLTSPV